MRHLRRPRGLMPLQPRAGHPEWVEHILAVHLVERLTGDLLDENAADHVSGVRVVEALARSKPPGSVLGRVVHELDRPPRPAGILAQAGGKRLLAEVVRHPGRVGEQLARRRVREVFKAPPAVEQLWRQLGGKWLIKR